MSINKNKNVNLNSDGNKNIIKYENCSFVITESNKSLPENKIIPELKPFVLKNEKNEDILKINSSILKKILGKNNYKIFKKQIKIGETVPQETYNKFGIVELKILARFILNNLDISIENQDKLISIIKDTKIQNNKSNIKNLLDNVIIDIYNNLF